jgi:putative membrane protein
MKKNENGISFPPQRQPIGAIIILAFRSFRGLLTQFWPFLLVIFLNKSRTGRNLWFIIGGAGLALISFVLSLIGYYRFTFSVKNGEIIIEQGVFTRVRTNVPFGRVQSINFEQKLLHRILHLVLFRIDTAGSEQSEITIPAMRHETAVELRDLILAQKLQYSLVDSTDVSDEVLQPINQEIFKLAIRDLIKVGVSVNHLRTMGIILALVWGIYAETSDVVEDLFSNYSAVLDLETSGGAIWIYFAILVPALFLVAFLTSLILAVLRYYNVTVYRISGGLKVVAGLINRNEQMAQRKKTQVMTWLTNPVRKMFGMFNVRLKQASSSQVSARQAIVIPGCYDHHVNQLKSYYFGKNIDHKFQSYTIRKEIIFRYTLYFGVIPMIAIGALIYFIEDFIPYLILAWTPLTYLLFYIYQSKWKIHLNQELLLLEKGIFGRRFDMMYLYKIQSVSIRQTPYQVRKKLANLHIQTAAGNMVIPYIYKDFAEHIMNFIVYKIEVSHKTWM